MPEKDKIKIIESFKDKRVMVIGDAMLDAYWVGKANRLSPEAPVPVLSVSEKTFKPGGAANVALNIKHLHAIPYLFTIVGSDDAGQKLINILKEEQINIEGCIIIKNRISTVKTRIISHSQHILRIDEEQTNELSEKEKAVIKQKILKGIDTIKPHAIIFEDYDKGVLSEDLIKSVIHKANALKIPIAVDPKYKNFWHYQQVTLFKPNLRELCDATETNIQAKNIDSVINGDKALRKKLKNSIALITLSEHGVYISDKKNNYRLPAHSRNITDVSGAGDTVISVAALCLAAKTNIYDLAYLANLAGGLVCEKSGVVPITAQQLIQEITHK